jgi:hypothetical protein
MLYSPCLLGRKDLAKMNNSTLNIQYTIAITALSLYDYKDVSPETMEILPTNFATECYIICI